MKIVVAGCVAQQEGETLLRRVPEVDLVMGEWGGGAYLAEGVAAAVLLVGAGGLGGWRFGQQCVAVSGGRSQATN